MWNNAARFSSLYINPNESEDWSGTIGPRQIGDDYSLMERQKQIVATAAYGFAHVCKTIVETFTGSLTSEPVRVPFWWPFYNHDSQRFQDSKFFLRSLTSIVRVWIQTGPSSTDLISKMNRHNLEDRESPFLSYSPNLRPRANNVRSSSRLCANPKIRELKDGKTHHLGGPNPGGASRLATAAKVTERLAPQLAAQQIHSPI